MRTRRGPSSAQRDDVLDLRERQPEPATLLDKGQHTQGVGGIDAVPGGGATRGRQNAARFIKAQRLSARAAAGDHLADQQPILHVEPG